MNILIKIYLFFLFLFLNAFVGMFYDIIPELKNFDMYKRTFCEFGIVVISIISINKKSLIYLYLFLAILIIGVISSLRENGISLFQFINGSRDFIPIFFSLIFITNMLNSSKKEIFIQKMNRFIALFLLINVPVCILQFLAFGIGTANGDAIGGTAGWGGER